MSPQLINKMLHQNWFLSSQVKELGRMDRTVFNQCRALEFCYGLQNAAAKHIRRFNHHHRNSLIFVIYFVIISNICIKYVCCDIEPQPPINLIDDDDHDLIGIGKDLNAHKHLPSVNKPDVINIDELNNNKSKRETDNGSFRNTFVWTLSMILCSELGDKTFFIAAIMAMRHSRLVVFTGAISALILMTILSSECVVPVFHSSTHRYCICKLLTILSPSLSISYSLCSWLWKIGQFHTAYLHTLYINGIVCHIRFEDDSGWLVHVTDRCPRGTG